MVQEFEAPARLKWVDTGIDVNAGEDLYFRAVGVWIDWFIPTNPEGYRTPLLYWLGLKPRIDDHGRYFRLMGRIAPAGKEPEADDPHATFPIGCRRRVVSPKKGRLYVFANDREGFYRNNYGRVRVQLSREEIPDLEPDQIWDQARRLLARTNGVSAIIGLLALVWFGLSLPQGRDLMITVAEDTGAVPSWPASAFWVSALLLGLQAWFWSRTIIVSNYGHVTSNWRPRIFLLWLPRVLAAVPFFAAAKSLAGAGAAPVWPITSVLSGIALALALWARRRIFGLRDDAFDPDSPLQGHARATAQKRQHIAGATGFVVATASVMAAFVAMAWFWWRPVGFAQFLGPAAVVCLAVALIIPIIASLSNFVRVTRFPVALTLLAWVALIGPLSDNHEVGARRAGGQEEVADTQITRPLATVDEAVAAWVERQKALHVQAADGGYPIVFVASEGGASRAGYWTALVLQKLDATPAADQEAPAALKPPPPPAAPEGRFSDRVFAISSVSGGSVGAAGYVVAATEAAGVGPVNDSYVTRFSGQDFLSPALAGMFFTDLLQRFVPIAFLPDRAETLERSWEQGWTRACRGGHPGGRSQAGAGPFACTDLHAMERGFLSLWPNLANLANTGEVAKNRWRPLLFVNGVRQEDGRRVITAPIRIDPDHFPNAVDFHMATGRDVRLSTAILNGARFPYVSPGGVMMSANRKRVGHILDGGYFDGIGADTLGDLVRAVMNSQTARALAQNGTPLRPIIVEISNNDDARGADLSRARLYDQCQDPSLYSGPTKSRLDDMLGPVVGLYQVRGAHATSTAAKLAKFGPPDVEARADRPDTSRSAYAYAFVHLSPFNGDHLPMDWVLSQAAQNRAQRLAAIDPTPQDLLAPSADPTRPPVNACSVDAVLRLIVNAAFYNRQIEALATYAPPPTPIACQ